MKMFALLLLAVSLCFLSCKDQGKVAEYVEIVNVSPLPNQANVEKATLLTVELNREVWAAEAGKITMRYVDDTASVRNYSGDGLMSPTVRYLCNSPFIWKPGRTVEVTIPQTIADQDGNTMKQGFVFRFTIAHDSLPFQLLSSTPRNGDTISISPRNNFTSGRLTFSDYVPFPDSALSITPWAKISRGVREITDSRNMPDKIGSFILDSLRAGVRYELVVHQRIKDYEGETLPQDYRIVFYTKP